jgi:hypothetical protein
MPEGKTSGVTAYAAAGAEACGSVADGVDAALDDGRVG